MNEYLKAPEQAFGNIEASIYRINSQSQPETHWEPRKGYACRIEWHDNCTATCSWGCCWCTCPCHEEK